jgi:hypothetical protein
MTFQWTTALRHRRSLRSVAFNEQCTSPNCDDSDTNEDPVLPPEDPRDPASTEAALGQDRPSIEDLLQGAPGAFLAALGRLLGRLAGAEALPALA